jgi:hypothetical protein
MAPKKTDKSIGSSHEALMIKLLNELLPNHIYIKNGYYSFLMSPKNQPMQLDVYFPDLKLAFEYQGRQHTHYSPYFFKSRKQFEYLKACDKLKKKLCKEAGITLICIDYTKKITSDYLKMRIVKAGRKGIFEL